jgi:hypothetical protein
MSLILTAISGPIPIDRNTLISSLVSHLVAPHARLTISGDESDNVVALCVVYTPLATGGGGESARKQNASEREG